MALLEIIVEIDDENRDEDAEQAALHVLRPQTAPEPGRWLFITASWMKP